MHHTLTTHVLVAGQYPSTSDPSLTAACPAQAGDAGSGTAQDPAAAAAADDPPHPRAAGSVAADGWGMSVAVLTVPPVQPVLTV